MLQYADDTQLYLVFATFDITLGPVLGGDQHQPTVHLSAKPKHNASDAGCQNEEFAATVWSGLVESTLP